jgi:hypothetical protein
VRSIEYRHRVWVLGAANNLNRCFTLFSRSLQLHTALPKMHQTLVDCQSVKPRCKCRLTSETTNLTKELNKASCAKSSASAGFCVILKHKEYTRRLCRSYNISNGLHIALAGSQCQRVVRKRYRFCLAFSTGLTLPNWEDICVCHSHNKEQTRGHSGNLLNRAKTRNFVRI